MFINNQLAKQIQTKAHAILNRDILIADTTGHILVGAREQAAAIVPEALRAAQGGQSVISQDEGRAIKWSPFVYEDQTIGVFGIVIDDGPITPEALSLLTGLAEVIVHQYIVLDRLHSTEVIKAQFILDVLQAPLADADEVYRQADVLQLNIRSPQAVMLAHLEDFEQKITADKQDLASEEQRLAIIREAEAVCDHLRNAFMGYQDNVFVYGGQNTFVILKGIGGESLNTFNTLRFIDDKAAFIKTTLSKIHRKAITIGAGQYYGDLGGLRKSYQDARIALNIGVKIWGLGRVYTIRAVGMFASLSSIPNERKAELAHQILNPLVRDEQLFKTVQAFLNHNLNLTEAADSIHIHRNTLIYRLDKTKKLIGLDPRVFEDALQIKVGLMFYRDYTN